MDDNPYQPPQEVLDRDDPFDASYVLQASFTLQPETERHAIRNYAWQSPLLAIGAISIFIVSYVAFLFFAARLFPIQISGVAGLVVAIVAGLGVAVLAWFSGSLYIQRRTRIVIQSHPLLGSNQSRNVSITSDEIVVRSEDMMQSWPLVRARLRGSTSTYLVVELKRFEILVIPAYSQLAPSPFDEFTRCVMHRLWRMVWSRFSLTR